jgi:hypothetical protein
MMSDTGTERTLATKVTSPIQGYDRGTGNLHEGVENLGRERTLSVGQSVKGKGGNERKSAQPTTIVVIEQWICFVLGLVCMAFGMWGICMTPEPDALSVYIAWLGSLYVPTLRVTAVVCVGLGLTLIRRGWAHLWLFFDFQQLEDYSDLLAGTGVSRRSISPARRTVLVSTCNGWGATMKTKMKEDLEDIPAAYLLCVVLAIIAIVAGAVAAVIRLF